MTSSSSKEFKILSPFRVKGNPAARNSKRMIDRCSMSCHDRRPKLPPLPAVQRKIPDRIRARGPSDDATARWDLPCAPALEALLGMAVGLACEAEHPRSMPWARRVWVVRRTAASDLLPAPISDPWRRRLKESACPHPPLFVHGRCLRFPRASVTP
jgi:hypothetical protein